MTTTPQPPTSLLDGIHALWSSVWRYRWQSIGILLIGMTLVVVVLLLIPRKYESQGRFFVLLGRGGVTLDPTATMSKNVHVQESRDAEINSVADILESRAVLEPVVDQIGPDRILRARTWLAQQLSLPDWEFPSLGDVLPDDEAELGADRQALEQRDRAIRRLERNLKVKPTKRAATILISARGSSPLLAQEIVQTIMDTYRELHIKAHHTPGSYPFFEEQFRRQEVALEEKQNALRDFKNDIRVTSIDGERSSIQSQIDRVQLTLLDTEGELAAAVERKRRLQEQYDTLKAELVTAVVSGTANEGADLMRDRLFSLEMQEKELVARFNETHPEVRSVREAIGTARNILDDHPYDRREVTTAVNPTRLDVHGQLLAVQAEEKAIRARRAALTDQRSELLARAEDLNTNEARYQMLQRDLQIVEANHRNYAEKLEEARINRALDALQISNVNVVQPPSLVLKPVSPRRSLIAVLSAAVLSLFAVGFAHLRDTAGPRSPAAATSGRELPAPTSTCRTEPGIPSCGIIKSHDRGRGLRLVDSFCRGNTVAEFNECSRPTKSTPANCKNSRSCSCKSPPRNRRC